MAISHVRLGDGERWSRDIATISLNLMVDVLRDRDNNGRAGRGKATDELVASIEKRLAAKDPQYSLKGFHITEVVGLRGYGECVALSATPL